MCAALLLPSGPAWADAAPLPASFPRAPDLVVNQGSVIFETLGEAEIPLPNRPEPLRPRGRFWNGEMAWLGVPEDMPGREVWARMRAVVRAAGWTIVHEFDQNPFQVTLRRQQGAGDSWLHLSIGSAPEMRFQIVEVGGAAVAFRLPSPAPRPEVLDPDRGDIPYLPPPPGAQQVGGGSAGPMVVPLPGQEQPHWVADSSVGRLYHRPGLSNLELITAYEAALKQAGWTVLEAIAPRQGSNPHLLARYTRNGRDLWLLLSGGGGDISLRVADAGIDDAAARLKRECRLPLSGVFFDFDRATLRPDSEPALRRGQSALVANAGLNVEIQGHTDNVGQDAYNLKLSESRAAAVADWLAANGVARSRLSSRGFGRLQPVADNATDDGRARNRRVEIVCRK